MDFSAKKVLHINLKNRHHEIKSYPDLNKYMGGVALGLKLMTDHIKEDPMIFSVGPFNGFFPFASKTSVVTMSEGAIEDIYLGGSLSFRIRFLGVDAVVLSGKSEIPVVLDIADSEVSFKPKDTDVDTLGLPGKRCVLRFGNVGLLHDDYFMAKESILERKFVEKNIFSAVITGSKTFEIKNPKKYKELFKSILNLSGKMRVEPSNKPSCSGCPMGCEKSRVGEIGGNVLIHSLVACTFAENIYSDVGTIFSCLNVLGYDYTHEDIENVPKLVERMLNEL